MHGKQKYHNEAPKKEKWTLYCKNVEVTENWRINLISNLKTRRLMKDCLRDSESQQ